MVTVVAVEEHHDIQRIVAQMRERALTDNAVPAPKLDHDLHFYAPTQAAPWPLS